MEFPLSFLGTVEYFRHQRWVSQLQLWSNPVWIQEEPGEGVFCTGTFLSSMNELFLKYQPYKNISDSVISVCLSHELLPLGSLGPRTVSSSNIYTAPTVSELKLPKVLICTSVKAFLQSCWSRVSEQQWLFTQLYLFSFKAYLLIFFKTMCLLCFFGKLCQEIKKTTKPSANGAKKRRNVFLHPTPL